MADLKSSRDPAFLNETHPEPVLLIAMNSAESFEMNF